MRGASWSRDGFIYFAGNVAVGLSKVSENGGEVAKVTEIDSARDERTHRWPQALPDGSAVHRDERYGPAGAAAELGRAAGIALKAQAAPAFFRATA